MSDDVLRERFNTPALNGKRLTHPAWRRGSAIQGAAGTGDRLRASFRASRSASSACRLRCAVRKTGRRETFISTTETAQGCGLARAPVRASGVYKMLLSLDSFLTDEEGGCHRSSAGCTEHTSAHPIVAERSARGGPDGGLIQLGRYHGRSERRIKHSGP